jgi:hypothetical protein
MAAWACQVAPSEALHAAVLQRLLLNLRLWAAAPLQVQRPFQAMLLKLARVRPFVSFRVSTSNQNTKFCAQSRTPLHWQKPVRKCAARSLHVQWSMLMEPSIP